MTALLDAPEFQDAIASVEHAAQSAAYISREWNDWCDDLDAKMGQAIQWIDHWKKAAIFADSQRRTGVVDLWALGDVLIPQLESFERDFEQINHALERSVPACPLDNYAAYQIARQDMAKIVAYFSNWPRTNREREDRAMQDHAAGNSARFVEIADGMCH